MFATRPRLLLLAGPPFGSALFRQVQERLGWGEAESVLALAGPGGDWRTAADAIAARCSAEPTVVVAHGLAVPAAVAAATRRAPAGLVLMNGPLRRVDPFARALGRIAAAPGGAAALSATVLQPALWLAWLRSSAGLRRAVVNPYVMDRDTVALLCGPLVEAAEGRRSVAAWLRGLRELPAPGALTAPLLLLWGDGDPLYPSSEAAFLEASVPGARHVAVPGGQHAHPEERPWEVADRLAAWLSEQGFATGA